jgi:hypothetical protein
MLQWVGFFCGAGVLVSLLSSFAVGFPRPLEFSQEEWAAIGQPAAEPATAGRARVPQPQERLRRQRRTKEPAKQQHARSKDSRRSDI